MSPQSRDSDGRRNFSLAGAKTRPFGGWIRPVGGLDHVARANRFWIGSGGVQWLHQVET